VRRNLGPTWLEEILDHRELALAVCLDQTGVVADELAMKTTP